MTQLKESGDILQSDHSWSQTLLSSISGIDSSIHPPLTNNHTTMQSSITIQSYINTTLTNSIHSIISSIFNWDSKVFAIQSANTSKATTNSVVNHSTFCMRIWSYISLNYLIIFVLPVWGDSVVLTSTKFLQHIEYYYYKVRSNVIV